MMAKTFHFISGLPRAGTTLLSSILKQNPILTAGISDPLEMYVNSIIRDTNTAAGMEKTVSLEKRKDIIRDMFESFYKGATPVCFNTNRGWAAETALLAELFPAFKMIVCLREIPWILDSFEQLQAKNPFTIKPLYNHQALGTVYDRCNMLMGGYPNFAGYVAGPLANVKQSMFSNEKSHILYVEYDTLVQQPVWTMKVIYDFLGLPDFAHDFDNVEDSYDEFDDQARIQGLHTVRRKVEHRLRPSILPGDIWQQYESNSFWKAENFDNVKSQLNWVHPALGEHARQVSPKPNLQQIPRFNPPPSTLKFSGTRQL